MPEILKWCLCGNTHCTPSVVLLAFWIGQIVFPTSEYLCPELCHNDQLLMTSGKTLVNFSLCDSLWFFVILCAFSILFSTLCEMRREGVLWTSLWGREGDFCSRVERCEPRDRCGLLRSLPEAVAIPPPGRRRPQWRQEFLWSLEDQACCIGICNLHLKNPLEKPLRFQAFWSFWACTHTSLYCKLLHYYYKLLYYQ